MNRKIIGVTVGTPLPKPDMRQTDPKKGDYVKGKEEYALKSEIPKPEVLTANETVLASGTISAGETASRIATGLTAADLRRYDVLQFKLEKTSENVYIGMDCSCILFYVKAKKAAFLTTWLDTARTIMSPMCYSVNDLSNYFGKSIIGTAGMAYGGVYNNWGATSRYPFYLPNIGSSDEEAVVIRLNLDNNDSLPDDTKWEIRGVIANGN